MDYAAPGLTSFMQVVTAIISSSLPMISVVVLYFVHPVCIRFGIIGAFAMVFLLGVALFAGADRNEIFSATAANVSFETRRNNGNRTDRNLAASPFR
jgi:predicted neutral ceramidase superfamily lipid hydrolase